MEWDDGTVYLRFPTPAPRSGARWTDPEREYLRKAVLRGDSFQRICALLGRSHSGVAAELLKMRFLHFDRRTFKHTWNHRATGRQDQIAWDEPPLKVRRDQMVKMVRFCKNFLKE